MLFYVALWHLLWHFCSLPCEFSAYSKCLQQFQLTENFAMLLLCLLNCFLFFVFLNWELNQKPLTNETLLCVDFASLLCLLYTTPFSPKLLRTKSILNKVLVWPIMSISCLTCVSRVLFQWRSTRQLLNADESYPEKLRVNNQPWGKFNSCIQSYTDRAPLMWCLHANSSHLNERMES